MYKLKLLYNEIKLYRPISKEELLNLIINLWDRSFGNSEIFNKFWSTMYKYKFKKGSEKFSLYVNNLNQNQINSLYFELKNI